MSEHLATDQMAEARYYAQRIASLQPDWPEWMVKNMEAAYQQGVIDTLDNARRAVHELPLRLTWRDLMNGTALSGETRRG